MIEEFQGNYRWLSNFWVDENKFCVEVHYQAAKAKYEIDRQRILAINKPGEAKRLGNQITIREDWNLIKDQIMEELIRKKFQNPGLAFKLIGTGSEELVEGNYWGDRYWGVCNGIGQNKLGEILMKIRRELKRNAL